MSGDQRKDGLGFGTPKPAVLTVGQEIDNTYQSYLDQKLFDPGEPFRKILVDLTLKIKKVEFLDDKFIDLCAGEHPLEEDFCFNIVFRPTNNNNNSFKSQNQVYTMLRAFASRNIEAYQYEYIKFSYRRTLMNVRPHTFTTPTPTPTTTINIHATCLPVFSRDTTSPYYNILVVEYIQGFNPPASKAGSSSGKQQPRAFQQQPPGPQSGSASSTLS